MFLVLLWNNVLALRSASLLLKIGGAKSRCNRASPKGVRMMGTRFVWHLKSGDRAQMRNLRNYKPGNRCRRPSCLARGLAGILKTVWTHGNVVDSRGQLSQETVCVSADIFHMKKAAIRMRDACDSPIGTSGIVALTIGEILCSGRPE